MPSLPVPPRNCKNCTGLDSAEQHILLLPRVPCCRLSGYCLPDPFKSRIDPSWGARHHRWSYLCLLQPPEWVKDAGCYFNKV